MARKWHDAEFAELGYRLADQRFVHSLKTFNFFQVLTGTFGVWTQIVAAWCLALLFNPWLAIASFLILVAAQQTMATWVHEASHHNLLKDKKHNDRWANFFFAAPMGMNVATYRDGHMTHHIHLSGQKDYDRHVHAVDLTGMNLWVEIAKRLTGWEGLKVAFQKYIPFFEQEQTENRQPLKRTPPTIGFLLIAAFWNGLFLGTCILAGRWYLYFILWAYPLFTVAQFLNMVRTCAEHQPEGFPATDLDKPPIVRTTLPSALEKWLIYGINFNYHLEHHLWPHVPFFNLPKLHAHLVERGFYEQRPDLLQRTAFGSFWQLHRLSAPREGCKGVVVQ